MVVVDADEVTLAILQAQIRAFRSISTQLRSSRDVMGEDAVRVGATAELFHVIAMTSEWQDQLVFFRVVKGALPEIARIGAITTAHSIGQRVRIFLSVHNVNLVIVIGVEMRSLLNHAGHFIRIGI